MINARKFGLTFLFLSLISMLSSAAMAASQPNQAMTLAPNKVMQAARAGDADAEYALGYMMYYGKGVKQDIDGSYHWFQKAAAQGQPQAVKALEILRQSKHPGIATVSHQPGHLQLHPHHASVTTMPHANTNSSMVKPYAVGSTTHHGGPLSHPSMAPRHPDAAAVPHMNPSIHAPSAATMGSPHTNTTTVPATAVHHPGPVLHMQADTAAGTPHSASQTPHLAPIPVDPQQPAHATPPSMSQQHTATPSQQQSTHPVVAPHAVQPKLAPQSMQHHSIDSHLAKQSTTAIGHMLASSRHYLSLIPAHHFVIQLMSARSMRSVVAFMRQHNIHDGHLYQTKRKGRTWMILVQGDYPSHASALRALRAHYGHLKNKPWVKSAAAVQHELMR